MKGNNLCIGRRAEWGFQQIQTNRPAKMAFEAYDPLMGPESNVMSVVSFKLLFDLEISQRCLWIAFEFAGDLGLSTNVETNNR